MGRLIELLRRFGNVFLFLFLQIIAFVLIINRNEHQRKVFAGFSSTISGSLQGVSSNISGYFNLGMQNEMLQEENNSLRIQNMRLRNELSQYKFKVPYFIEHSELPDSVLPANGYSFINCRVISSTLNNNYNYITLNKGRKQGVREGMGLLSPNGVAGQVIAVSEHYSVAISLLNKKFKMSARLLKSKTVGTLSWSGEDPEFATLEFIPETEAVKTGETVTTSNYSTIFPEYMTVGKVESFHNEDQDGFHEIKVRLSTDFRALGNLYLVDNKFQEEIDSLQAVIE